MLVAAQAGIAPQAHVGRRQPHLRAVARTLREAEAARGHAQALAEPQVHAVLEGDHAVDQQREAVEAAGLDAVDADARMAVGERGIGLARAQVGAQRVGALLRLSLIHI